MNQKLKVAVLAVIVVLAGLTFVPLFDVSDKEEKVNFWEWLFGQFYKWAYGEAA